MATSAKKEAEAAREVLECNRDELLQSQRDLRTAQVLPGSALFAEFTKLDSVTYE